MSLPECDKVHIQATLEVGYMKVKEGQSLSARRGGRKDRQVDRRRRPVELERDGEAGANAFVPNI